MTDPAPYRNLRQGRSRRALAAVLLVYALLIALILMFQASLWLMGALALTTLPTLWDLWRNPQAGFELNTTGITWFTGRRRGQVSLTELDHIRLDTRWDFSVRATLVLLSGQRVRLPFECMPPHRELEAVALAFGLQTERHHFTIRKG